MNITSKWLEENNACEDGRNWFHAQKETDLVKVLKALIKDEKFEWANWTITKVLTYKQNVQYACNSANQSLYYFEKVYPKDKRPRKAILAALTWVKFPTEINRSAAESAAILAWAAESAAESAESAARSAGSAAWAALAAWAAARSAGSAEWAAESAWAAARSARSAGSAARSARSAGAAEWKRILNYGVKLCK